MDAWGYAYEERQAREQGRKPMVTFRAKAERAYPGLEFVKVSYLGSGLGCDVLMRTPGGEIVERRLTF